MSTLDPEGKPPTLETVAALAGVSRSTASRVINGDRRVAPHLERRVRHAIARLGYVPNRAAQSLATRRSNSVALLMREPVEFGATDPYLSSFLVSVGQSLAGSGLQLVVMMTRVDGNDHPATEYLGAGRVDGVLVASVHTDDPLPAQLSRLGIPTVVGGRIGPRPGGLTYVDVDNVGGGAMAAGHLLGEGRTTLATISGPPDLTAAVDRHSGYCNALRAAGLPDALAARGYFTRESGRRAMEELLERQPDLDAVFAANDLMALGALEVLRGAGRSVPDDVAVVGFDDIELAEHAVPPLTTVRQPVALQAQTMVRLLLGRLNGRSVEAATVLDVSLVRRASA